ncbi:MAG: hypothetical protein KGJ97_11025 [Xanthomonadaceae bacterium]|nr:hypothetical protein [Xanthomonadaceae bacterium]
MASLFWILLEYPQPHAARPRIIARNPRRPKRRKNLRILTAANDREGMRARRKAPTLLHELMRTAMRR